MSFVLRSFIQGVSKSPAHICLLLFFTSFIAQKKCNYQIKADILMFM
jgi:hypothetical protein